MQTLDALPAFEIEELKSWLLQVISDAGEIELHSEPDIVVELGGLFGASPVATQEKFKGALARAIMEWQRPARSYWLLRDLVFLTARVKATNAAIALAQLLRSKSLWVQSRNVEAFEVCSASIGTLGGFLPELGGEISDALEHMFFDPGLEPRLGAQVFNALCRHDRREYPRYLRRYLELRAKVPGYFNDEWVFSFFTDSVSPEIIALGFDRLSDEQKWFLLAQLGRPMVAPVGLTIDFMEQKMWIFDETEKKYAVDFPRRGSEFRTLQTAYNLAMFSSNGSLARIKGILGAEAA